MHGGDTLQIGAGTYKELLMGSSSGSRTCTEADAAVAVWQGLIWQVSLCAACARLHQEGHALQLELFGEEEDARGDA
jgi:hypothetical protein